MKWQKCSGKIALSAVERVGVLIVTDVKSGFVVFVLIHPFPMNLQNVRSVVYFSLLMEYPLSSVLNVGAQISIFTRPDFKLCVFNHLVFDAVQHLKILKAVFQPC